MKVKVGGPLLFSSFIFSNFINFSGANGANAVLFSFAQPISFSSQPKLGLPSFALKPNRAELDMGFKADRLHIERSSIEVYLALNAMERSSICV